MTNDTEYRLLVRDGAPARCVPTTWRSAISAVLEANPVDSAAFNWAAEVACRCAVADRLRREAAEDARIVGRFARRGIRARV